MPNRVIQSLFIDQYDPNKHPVIAPERFTRASVIIVKYVCTST